MVPVNLLALSPYQKPQTTILRTARLSRRNRMFKEEDLLQSYFTEKDIKGMTHEEFQIAMIGLVEKGLMEMVEKDETRFYRPTELLRKMKNHFNSNPKTQN
jgi:hypothetical protein